MDGIKLLGLLVLVFSITNPLNLSAAPISPGDLIISEVMADPAVVSDARGEWFELHNLTGSSLDLNGLYLSDSGANLHVIDNGGALTLNPFGYLVFGKSDDVLLNGDYVADYVYTGFTLANSDDEIIIATDAGVELVRLEYTQGFAVTGKSRELAGTVGFPLSGTDYVLSTSTYGLGDFGTPGGAGDSNWTVEVQPVPVPAAIWLFGSAVVGFMGVARRKPA